MRRRPAFADTAYYVALGSPKDALNVRATEAAATVRRVVTTEYVLVEVANFFTRVEVRPAFVHLLALVRRSRTTEIIRASPDLFDRGAELFADRPDKEWSLTDCISFVAMTDRGLTDALTADHHFAQAGFRPLLA